MELNTGSKWKGMLIDADRLRRLTNRLRSQILEPLLRQVQDPAWDRCWYSVRVRGELAVETAVKEQIREEHDERPAGSKADRG